MKLWTNWRWNSRKATSSGAALISVAAVMIDQSMPRVGRREHLQADGERAGLDGVRVYNPAGLAIGHIHLAERCANLCFGGAKRNRLFMAASHSLYALYVNVQGA